MIRGIHHIALHTANFDSMIEFYRRAFGFEQATKEIRWENSEFVDNIIDVKGSAARTLMLKAGNVYLEIFEYFSPPPRDAAPLRPHDHGYTHFAVDVTDIETDYKRLIEAGMTFAAKVPDDFGGIRALYGKDPDGNIIEIQQLAPGHDADIHRLPLVKND